MRNPNFYQYWNAFSSSADTQNAKFISNYNEYTRNTPNKEAWVSAQRTTPFFQYVCRLAFWLYGRAKIGKFWIAQEEKKIFIEKTNKINFYVYFCSEYVKMKTNRIMDEIRETISPEMKMQMELSVAIANRIYEILEEKGMSQKDFAQLMGKTETEISRWLSGTHNLTLATLCKISVALGENLLEVPVNQGELVEA